MGNFDLSQGDVTPLFPRAISSEFLFALLFLAHGIRNRSQLIEPSCLSEVTGCFSPSLSCA